MAYPNPPEISYSYEGFAAGQGNNSFPGTQLDNDLAEIVYANTQILDFLNLFVSSEARIRVEALPNAIDLDAATATAQAAAATSVTKANEASASADAAASSADTGAEHATAAGSSATAAAASAALATATVAAMGGSARFTAAGAATWECPSGVTKAKVTVVGGGGNGAASGTTGAGGGGGAGGCATRWYDNLVPGTTYNLAVGAAGAVSTFTGPGSVLTANGGSVGASSGVTGQGGQGGAATNGDVNGQGSAGANGFYTASTVAVGGTGAGSVFGGGGRGGIVGASGNAAGSPGSAPGAGGGGGVAQSGGTVSGGAGAVGAIIIEY